jgi:hypothetical protein
MHKLVIDVVEMERRCGKSERGVRAIIVEETRTTLHPRMRTAGSTASPDGTYLSLT